MIYKGRVSTHAMLFAGDKGIRIRCRKNPDNEVPGTRMTFPAVILQSFYSPSTVFPNLNQAHPVRSVGLVG